MYFARKCVTFEVIDMCLKANRFAVAVLVSMLLLGMHSLAQAAVTKSRAPIRSVAYSVPAHARGAMFERIESFAKLHGFAIRIAPMNPAGDSFTIRMYREDIKILGSNSYALNPDDALVFRFRFHGVCDVPVADATLTALVRELEAALLATRGIARKN